MSEEMVGKELVLVAPEAVTKKSKPTLIQVGKGSICSTGKFHPALAVSYIQDKPRSKWIKVGELARVFTGANTIPGKKRVRKGLPAVFKQFLDRNDFLLQHRDRMKNGRTEEVKLIEASSSLDRQQADTQLQQMKARHELSTDKYQKAINVLALLEAAGESTQNA
jgi:hypothetical protein